MIVIDNGITKLANYRLQIIGALPQLKMLDYKKVKLEERKRAEAVGEGGSGDEVMSEADQKEAATAKGAEVNTQSKPVDVTAIKAAIASAQTIEEVQKLEAALQTGVMPSGL